MWYPVPDLIMDLRTFYDHGIAFTYCFSVYHSVSILDGAEMVPANSHQAIVLSVLVILSEFIHAHIIGTMEIVLHSMNRRSKEFYEQIEFATSTMKNIRLDRDTQKEVLSYLAKIHKKLDVKKDLEHLMMHLSPSLRGLITKRVFLNVVSEHPVFTGIPEAYEYIIENLEAKQFGPD